jgi:hypothetical protein
MGSSSDDEVQYQSNVQLSFAQPTAPIEQERESSTPPIEAIKECIDPALTVLDQVRESDSLTKNDNDSKQNGGFFAKSNYVTAALPPEGIPAELNDPDDNFHYACGYYYGRERGIEFGEARGRNEGIQIGRAGLMAQLQGLINQSITNRDIHPVAIEIESDSSSECEDTDMDYGTPREGSPFHLDDEEVDQLDNDEVGPLALIPHPIYGNGANSALVLSRRN